MKKLGIEPPKGPKEKEKKAKENIIEGDTIVKEPGEKEKEKEV
jgi:hypothetical protein